MRSTSVRRTLSIAFWILCALASPPRVLGQSLSAGLIGGAGLTGGVQGQTLSSPGTAGSPAVTHTESTSKDYVVGGMLRIGLPASRLSLEADALYRPTRFSTFTSTVPSSSGSSAPSNTIVIWEFPILARYRFDTPGLKPVAEIGPSFRASGNLNDTSPSKLGATAGTGVELNWGRFGLSPELRYTRWAADNIGQPYQPRMNRNQVEFTLAWFRHLR